MGLQELHNVNYFQKKGILLLTFTSVDKPKLFFFFIFKLAQICSIFYMCL